MLLIAAVVWLTLATVHSLYRGTGAINAVPGEKQATAYAEACSRYGPISPAGFGYWWRCLATVEVADGRVVHVTVDHSKLTASDVGRGVEFREVCFNSDNTNCAYGRPANLLLGVGIKVLGIIQDFAGIAFAFLIVVYLLGAVLGKDRTNRLIGHREKPVQSDPPV